MPLQPAMDMGGTFIKAGLVDPDGNVVAEKAIPTRAEAGWEAAVEALVEAGRYALAEAASAPGSATDRVGVAVPGVVDAERGVAVTAVNIGWQNLPLRDLLAERLGVRVALGQDIDAAGLAECSFGAAAGADSALIVPVGTGVGATYIRRGRSLHGFHGGVVEIGHVPLGWSDEVCGCGGIGCLERVASASAIARRYAAAAGAQEDGIDALAVQRLMEAGDRLAQAIWNDAVRALGQGIVTAMRMLDPERVVIGGGLGKAGPALLEPLAAYLDAHLTFQLPPRLAASALGSSAGLVGASLMGRAADDNG
jgi:glucokinase